MVLLISPTFDNVPTPSASEKHLQDILTLAWSLKIANIIVLSALADFQQVHAFTHFPFASSSQCERIEPNLLTTYTFGAGFEPTISAALLFPKKYRNLHKCPLYISTYPFVPHIVIPHEQTTESGDLKWYDHVGGLDGCVLHTLEENLNFSSKIANRGTRGTILNLRNGTDSFGMILRNEVNITIGNLGITNSRLQHSRASTSVYFVPIMFAVPPGRPFSALQRLLQPFRPQLWKLLGIIGFGTVTVLLLQDTRAVNAERRRLCVGRDAAPLLTAIAVALGCSVPELPRRNFARFMFVSWTTLALVLRTVYQAGLCYFMQRNVLQSRPGTLQELVAANYTINMEKSIRQMFADFEELRGSSIVEYEMEQLDALHLLHQVDTDVATVVSGIALSYHNRLDREGPKIPLPRERLMLITSAFYMPINSSLEMALNDPIQQMTSAGLIEHWLQEKVGLLGILHKNANTRTKPSILMLEQLLGAFWVCAILLAVSFVVFLLELILHRERVRKVKRNGNDYLSE